MICETTSSFDMSSDISQLIPWSSAECRRGHLSSSLVSGQKLTISNIVWILPEVHISLPERRRFFQHTPHWLLV